MLLLFVLRETLAVAETKEREEREREESFFQQWNRGERRLYLKFAVFVKKELKRSSKKARKQGNQTDRQADRLQIDKIDRQMATLIKSLAFSSILQFWPRSRDSRRTLEKQRERQCEQAHPFLLFSYCFFLLFSAFLLFLLSTRLFLLRRRN